LKLPDGIDIGIEFMAIRLVIIRLTGMRLIGMHA
jgi:hypothetical protein